MVTAAMNLKDTPWKKSYDQPRQHVKKPTWQRQHGKANLAKIAWQSQHGKDSMAKPTLPTKVRLVKAMVFPVVTYGCESWTVKKAEH